MTLFNNNKFYDAIGRLRANSPSGGIDLKDIVAATMPAGGSGRSTTAAPIRHPAKDAIGLLALDIRRIAGAPRS